MLRLLQEEEIRRVGSVSSRKINVRLVAATHRNLKQLAKDGQFREDLYYRLNVVALKLPPLRVRGADIIELADAMLTKYCDKLSQPKLSFSADAVDAINQYPWPGNVRELENAIERAVILCNGDRIEPADLQLDYPGEAAAPPPPTAIPTILNLDDMEKATIERALLKHGFNISRAAAELGLTRASLYRRMEKHGI